MDKIVSYEQVIGFVGDIRNLRQGYATNFFWDEQKHPYWILDNSFFYEKCENCYILFHQNIGFTNIFYISTSLDAFSEAYRQITLNNDHVIDVVCRNEGKGELDILKELGYEPYKCLYRMSHIGLLADDNWEKTDEVGYAHDLDVNSVYEALHQDFDPICEQLPSLQEVRDFANRQQILMIKDGEKLCGFLIYELSGTTTWYLRYWYTSPEYRNMKIGAKLLKASLVDGKATKRQQLWVISDNENAIKRYEHYGFVKEKIYDYVMIKRYKL